MVLCAGLGTRLRPLTERLPKPAVPVCGVPLIRFTLALLRGAGVRRAVVNVHHLPEIMERAARSAAASLGLELAVSREPIIAGTGIEARIVTERYRAGESVAELAQDYRLDAGQIEDAIRCETSEAA
jgi:mannose-1-phosphate guanylyltransferase